MAQNRVKNSVRNAAFGLLLKIITLVGAFVARTVLIYVLGVEYVGLEGLFTSILTMLNMAELGFSSAVVYKLYKPLAENDTFTVCALLKYYRKIYRVIGIVVFVIGIALTPFLPHIIKGNAPADVNLYLLYIIYLANTCFSYWVFAYKSVILNANNRNDLVSKITSLAYVGKYILQFGLLLLFKNYYVYVIVIPVTTLAINLGSALIVKKHYPQFICDGTLSLDDRKEIKTKVAALLYNKLGVTMISASDNIVISSFLGLTILGIYDSYYYIFTMLYYFFSVLHSAVTAGIGNSIVSESIDDNREIFKRLCFINYWLVGFCSICLVCLYESFISIWIGKDKCLGEGFALLMAIYFYFWMIRFIVIIFKNAQGLWQQDRFRAILEGILNLCLNILMVQIIGIYGVTLSTVVAMLVVSLPWETHVLFKHYFIDGMKEYFLNMLKWLLLTVLTGTATFGLCFFFPIGTWRSLLVRLAICLIIPNISFFLCNYKSNEFKYAFGLVKRILGK